MATLQSPGVSVTVVDESFYTPAEPGTTPLIIVATAQDKLNGAGTSTASGTTKANAGQAFKMTSQKDLVDTFGVPFFEKTASSNPVHGGERNEYGLLAAYSLLGVSNAAFIVRADVDLNQLEASATAPGAMPDDGAWWIDSQTSVWGIQEWNGNAATTVGGQKFTTKTPIVLTDDTDSKIDSGEPKTSVGSIGDYAVVLQDSTTDKTARIYYKSAGNSGAGVDAGSWVLVGSADWKASLPVAGGTKVYSSPTATVGLKFNDGATISILTTDDIDSAITKINTAGGGITAAKDSSGRLYIYADGTSNDGVVEIASTTGDATEIGLVVGTYSAPKLQQTPHTQVPQWKRSSTTYNNGSPTGSVWIKTTEPNGGARLRIKRWDSGSETWVSYECPLYKSNSQAIYYLDRTGGGAGLAANDLYAQTNVSEETGEETPETAVFSLFKRKAAGATTIVSAVAGTKTAGTYDFEMAETVVGNKDLEATKTISITLLSTATPGVWADKIATAINAAGFVNLEASVTTDNRVQITHKLGGDFRFSSGTVNLGNLFSDSSNVYLVPVGDSTYNYVATLWAPLIDSSAQVTADEPLNEPQDGQLWYNPEFSDVDIMIHNGNVWVGYRNAESPYNAKNPAHEGYAPSVAASNPYISGETVDGDLWISTADLENFPTIYRYNSSLNGPAATKWELVDKTDQLTESGILFADARWGDSGSVLPSTQTTIEDLLVSNFVDPDSPDPALYPQGMLLWNLRRSGGNVKKYRNSYIDQAKDNERYNASFNPIGESPTSGGAMNTYATDRWVTASPNNEDGSGSFGRHAQRGVVVAALKSVVDTSSAIRDEERRNFNLIAAPGYTELLSNLINLNIDRGLTAFVVGDTPFRLAADATTLTNWGSNAELVTDNGDNGLVSYDEYAAVFYPSGFTTDLSGSNAVVPPAHMMLKTIALSDNVAYPWFAPAGTRRGGITNATAVGYIDSLSGEFQTVALNEGQRDTLYDLKINPITFFNGVGLVNYGQKTRARNASALDRINVARLVVYLRSQLNKLARPYIFEPNDKITRDEIKQACESLLLELVGLRALYDFAVVCDESNNTPARIDRNELYVDIAIEPVKAVEFIYIPLRVKNTGEI
jgi:hypothetical protein